MGARSFMCVWVCEKFKKFTLKSEMSITSIILVYRHTHYHMMCQINYSFVLLFPWNWKLTIASNKQPISMYFIFFLVWFYWFKNMFWKKCNLKPFTLREMKKKQMITTTESEWWCNGGNPYHGRSIHEPLFIDAKYSLYRFSWAICNFSNFFVRPLLIFSPLASSVGIPYNGTNFNII